MDLESGAVKWVFQGLAGDATNLACLVEDKTNCPKENGPDLDFGGASAMLLTTSDGRQILVAGQKSGDVYALDPDTGKFVWKVKPGRGGLLGGVHFGMAANKNLIFVPINDAPDGQEHGEPAHPGVYAFDLASERVWSAPANPETCVGTKQCLIGYTQAITASPDLVFACSDDGWMRVLDAHSGGLLWQVDTKTPVKTATGEEKGGGSCGGGSGPVLYHGMLFVSSGYSLAGRIPGNLLFAFETK
jgi:polyvinyl alcohol dehydrogenase (cytochrome)